METSIALMGQVAGRIHDVRPVKEILDEVAREFLEEISGYEQYLI